MNNSNNQVKELYSEPKVAVRAVAQTNCLCISGQYSSGLDDVEMGEFIW